MAPTQPPGCRWSIGESPPPEGSVPAPSPARPSSCWFRRLSPLKPCLPGKRSSSETRAGSSLSSPRASPATQWMQPHFGGRGSSSYSSCSKEPGLELSGVCEQQLQPLGGAQRRGSAWECAGPRPPACTGVGVPVTCAFSLSCQAFICTASCLGVSASGDKAAGPSGRGNFPGTQALRGERLSSALAPSETETPPASPGGLGATGA